MLRGDKELLLYELELELRVDTNGYDVNDNFSDFELLVADRDLTLFTPLLILVFVFTVLDGIVVVVVDDVLDVLFIQTFPGFDNDKFGRGVVIGIEEEEGNNEGSGGGYCCCCCCIMLFEFDSNLFKVLLYNNFANDLGANAFLPPFLFAFSML